MNRRIVIQVKTAGRDSAGGMTETWSDEATVCAELVKAGGGQSVIADADRTSHDRQFRIRNRPIEASTHRIFYKLTFYDILAVDPEGVNDRLLLTTRATQAIGA